MPDVREQILSRLVDVLEGVEGFDKVRRNVRDLADWQVTAIVLDGTEVADEGDAPGRGASGPRRVTLTPSIVIAVQGAPETTGATANTQRARVLKAVLTDAALLALTVNGQSIRFVGSETVVDGGRHEAMHAMNLEFGFTYMLKISDL